MLKPLIHLLFCCKDTPFFAVLQIFEAKSSGMDEKKQADASQGGLPSSLNFFYRRKDTAFLRQLQIFEAKSSGMGRKKQADTSQGGLLNNQI